MNNHLKEIKGFPFYLMDISDGNVYSFRNGEKMLKGHVRADGRKDFSLMDTEGKKRTIMQNRLWYACMHNIEIDHIPDSLNVVNVNGKLELIDKQSLWNIMHKKKSEQSRNIRLEMLDRKEHEINLVRECYLSGDHTEVLRYCESLREEHCVWFSKKYRVIRETAEEIFGCALEHMITLIDSPSSMICELTYGMKGLMRKEYDKRKKTKALSIERYFDLIKRS